MAGQLYVGDARTYLAMLDDDSLDSCVTDPPYELGFMGKAWDSSGIAFSIELWSDVLRVLKPGGHCLVFGGTRTFHRVAVALEEAGFEIRDTMMWLYGQGFPKSMDLGKKDPTLEGWGTALKPAWEPIIMARKPFKGTVLANVHAYGTGAINIDGSRVGYVSDADMASATPQGAVTAKVGALAGGSQNDRQRTEFERPELKGRFPANVLMSHHEDCGGDPCHSDCPIKILDDQSGISKSTGGRTANITSSDTYGGGKGIGSSATKTADEVRGDPGFGDVGGASRFFYCAKAPKRERPVHVTEDGTKVVHETVKPLDLVRYLTMMVTPPDGTVLDPFMGSGTVAEAAILDGFNWKGSELNPLNEHLIVQRIERAKEALG